MSRALKASRFLHKAAESPPTRAPFEATMKLASGFRNSLYDLQEEFARRTNEETDPAVAGAYQSMATYLDESEDAVDELVWGITRTEEMFLQTMGWGAESRGMVRKSEKPI